MLSKSFSFLRGFTPFFLREDTRANSIAVTQIEKVLLRANKYRREHVGGPDYGGAAGSHAGSYARGRDRESLWSARGGGRDKRCGWAGER